MCACMFGRARAQMLLELESDRASLPALLQDIRARSNLSVKAFLAPGLEGGGVRVDSAESLHDFIARKTAPAPVPGVSAACVPRARRRRAFEGRQMLHARVFWARGAVPGALTPDARAAFSCRAADQVASRAATGPEITGGGAREVAGGREPTELDGRS